MVYDPKFLQYTYEEILRKIHCEEKTTELFTYVEVCSWLIG